jgi:bacterioferritin-associated ferredoxin
VYVCICNGVTERDIRHAVEAGCRTLPELTMRTGCGATCGTCLDTAAAILEDARGDKPELELPVLRVAA